MSRRLPRATNGTNETNGVAPHTDDSNGQTQAGHEDHQHPVYKLNSVLPASLHRFFFRYGIESTCYMLDPIEIALFTLFLMSIFGGTLYFLYSWIAQQ